MVYHWGQVEPWPNYFPRSFLQILVTQICHRSQIFIFITM